MLRNQAFEVLPREAGRRVDRLLRDRFPAVPSRSVRFALESGAVRVNAQVVPKGRSVREGEAVLVAEIAEARDWLPVPSEVPGVALAYEDAWVAVLCKPHDIHTEPHKPNETGTLAGHLRRRYPQVAEIAAVPGLTLLTRLDYATSGAVPAALTADAYSFLTREREHGNLVKRYLCLVTGTLREPMPIDYEIDAEGGETVRVRTGRKEPDPHRWTMIEPLAGLEGRTLVRATIRRGKRHQIRAHLAAAGHPIVGDRRYAAVPSEGPGKTRLMLHAEEVAFRHPGTGETIRVSCGAPPGFTADRPTEGGIRAP